jgi:hypothetical protein
MTPTERDIIKAAYELEEANRHIETLEKWIRAESHIVQAVLADKQAKKEKRCVKQ